MNDMITLIELPLKTEFLWHGNENIPDGGSSVGGGDCSIASLKS